MVKQGYKQTEVGVIPEDWDCREINSVIKEISMGPFGSDIPVSCFASEGIPVLNGHSISKIKLIDTFKNFVSEEKAKSLKKAVAQQGDIIVTHRGTIGQISYIPMGSQYKKYVISQSQFRVRLNKNTVNSHFVVSYFLSPKGQSFLLEKKGHTGVPALAQPTTNFRKLCIPLPPLPEQEWIANTLKNIDDLILSLEKQISKKKSIKQGAMQELLTGKRRLPGFSGEWNTCKLGSLGVFVKGTGISRNQSNSGNLPAVRYGELYTKHQNYVTNYFSYISEEVAANAQRVSRGDILFAASGETKEEIGKCAAIIHETDVYAGGDILIFRPSTQLNPVFMGTLLNTADVCKQRAEKGQGDAVVHIHADALSSINVMIPNIEEQQSIADILLGMDKEIELLESKLAKYRQVKQGMMQQLLTGKIRLV